MADSKAPYINTSRNSNESIRVWKESWSKEQSYKQENYANPCSQDATEGAIIEYPSTFETDLFEHKHWPEQ